MKKLRIAASSASAQKVKRPFDRRDARPHVEPPSPGERFAECARLAAETKPAEAEEMRAELHPWSHDKTPEEVIAEYAEFERLGGHL